MVSKAKLAANRRYNDKTYDQYTVRLRKDDMARARQRADDLALTLNGYVTRLVLDDLGEGESK